MLGSGILPDKYTFPYVIKACGGLKNISLARQVHDKVQSMGFEIDVFVGCSLIKVYADNGLISDACKLFNLIPQTDLVTWNGMISGYVQNGLMIEAPHCFREMISAGVKPDSITFASFLPSVSEFSNLKQGKEIQRYIRITFNIIIYP
ncbi:hypothetical protein UlMin_026910 [Ulmus minor]